MINTPMVPRLPSDYTVVCKKVIRQPLTVPEFEFLREHVLPEVTALTARQDRREIASVVFCWRKTSTEQKALLIWKELPKNA